MATLDTMRRENCDRCKNSTKGSTTLSMYNLDVICLTCKDEEKKRPDYKEAVETELREIRRGNYNFPGIGFKQLV